MLRLDKLTIKAQEAFQEAQEVAARHDQQQIEPLHLLAALIAQTDGVVRPLLTRLGTSPEALAKDIETALGRLPKVSGVASQHFSPAVNELFEKAFAEAGKISRRICFQRASAAGHVRSWAAIPPPNYCGAMA